MTQITLPTIPINVAQNPNSSVVELMLVADLYPEAVLNNSGLALLLLEDPASAAAVYALARAALFRREVASYNAVFQQVQGPNKEEHHWLGIEWTPEEMTENKLTPYLMFMSAGACCHTTGIERAKLFYGTFTGALKPNRIISDIQLLLPRFQQTPCTYCQELGQRLHKFFSIYGYF